MTNDKNHHENTIHQPLTDEERQRYEEQRQDWQKADRDRRCPGCAGNGYSVTLGRREPEATLCYICQDAPHPVCAPHAHMGTVDGEHFYESNLRCGTCAGTGEVIDYYTDLPCESGHAERCLDCGGLGILVMSGG